MEVHFTPEQEAQLERIATDAGTDVEGIVRHAALRLLEGDAVPPGSVVAEMRALRARIKPDPEGWTTRDYVRHGRRQVPRPMTPEAIETAARADSDAQPLTESDLKRMARTPQARIIRRALELTQEEFESRFHIPLGTLRDWEQGRATPDLPTRAYLTLIARDPERVSRVLNRK